MKRGIAFLLVYCCIVAPYPFLKTSSAEEAREEQEGLIRVIPVDDLISLDSLQPSQTSTATTSVYPDSESPKGTVSSSTTGHTTQSHSSWYWYLEKDSGNFNKGSYKGHAS